ncbi:MAG TPA: hypothetical protein VKE98_20955 [Gemmataceae bacterium]|nr:hypothetical protein [Gemmataceae bacterium]
MRKLIAAGIGLVILGASIGLADGPAEVKDRKGFIPYRNHQVLKGTAIGILLTDGQPVLGNEGRSGPSDQLVFATGGGSYRWVYVPTGNGTIRNLQVPVGDQGNSQTFPSLDMANPKSVAQWGIKQPYSLVEVQVNNGQGSPAGDSFVATNMKVLDGTKDYPINTTEVVQALKKRYAEYVKEKGKMIDAAMTEAAVKYLKGRKATGPREQSELMFLTWLPESKTLQAHFRTKVSDGAYTWVEGGGIRPFPLPPRKKDPNNPFLSAFPPAPPRFKIKTGTTFGVEFGMGYDVPLAGGLKAVQTQVLPFQSFVQELPPAPRVAPGGKVPMPPSPPL